MKPSINISITVVWLCSICMINVNVWVCAVKHQTISEVNSNNTNVDHKDIDYMSVEEPDEESERENVIRTTNKKSTENEKAVTIENKIKPENVFPDIGSTYKYSTGVITNMSDIVKMVRFVLLRGHIVLDAGHKVIVQNESRIERLINYLHVIQLRRGKHRILPMEDRDLACDEISDSKLHIKVLCKTATFDCLSASDLIQMLPPSIAFHQAITRICPLLLFRQSRPICVADAKMLLDNHVNKKIEMVEPSIERVWGFGVLFVTISILVSMGGLIVLPFLKKSSRTTILTFFEGLAVGGLCGSAILHLFPQAFDIVDEKYRAFFWNTSLIFVGIYLFYTIEMLVKILKTYYGKNRKKRVPSGMFRDEDMMMDTIYNGRQFDYYDSDSDNDSMHQRSLNQQPHGVSVSTISLRTGSPVVERKIDPENKQMIMVYNNPKVNLHEPSVINKEALISSTREQLVQCLSAVNVISPPPPVLMQRQSTPPIRRSSKERMVQNVALRRQDHETANLIVIDNVAWMIVLGDALLNFIDGLSIGAAFDRNILAGMSISVAVMLEEVTHRLGTFAVLIRAGMSMKQSFLYIFLSACACYPGLALGIFLGDEAEDASPYIFALAGGFFLYMALVDVMKAMTRTLDNASRKSIRSQLHIWALQNIGIVLSAISLALLAFYEKEMDFERQEIAEIEKNSFI